MKRLALVIFVVTLFAVFAAVHIRRQQGRFFIDPECAGLMLLKGGYRCWRVEYSYGQMIGRDGKWRKLWHFPEFRHLDIRDIQTTNGDFIFVHP